MAIAQFLADRNNHGILGIEYSYTQSESSNNSSVTISRVLFKETNSGWKGLRQPFGNIRFRASDSPSWYSDDNIWYGDEDYWVRANGSNWISFSGSAAFTVLHDSSGDGYFDVVLERESGHSYFDIKHEFGSEYADGDPQWACHYSDGTSIRVNLPRIDQTGPTISLSGSVNSSGTVTLSASADVSCSGWAYCIDGSGTWYAETGTASSKTFTIPNMTGSHSFQVRATRVSNGVTGYSSGVTTKTPTLSWSKNSVSTDSDITLTIRYIPAGPDVYVKYGNTVLWYQGWMSYQDSVTWTFSSSDLKQFFSDSGITTGQSITIYAEINGYSYTPTSFTLTAGSNMAPVVSTPTASIDQTTQPAGFPSTWIAGVSKAKIEATVTPGSNSSIAQNGVTLSYGSNSTVMAYDNQTGKYWAITQGTLIGNTVFTVTATDTRGLTGTNSYSLTGVQGYSLPTITIDEGATFRCDADGNKQSGGLFVRVKASASYDTGISGNALSLFKFYVEEDGSGSKTDLVNNVQSTAVALVNPDKDDAFHIIIEAQDLIGDIVQKRMQLPGGHRDFAMVNFYSSAAGERRTAIGIGMAPEVYAYMSHDTIQLPEYGEILIGGQPMHTMNYYGGGGTEGLLFQKDFLMVDTSTPYAMQNAAAAFIKPPSDSIWSNMPSSKVGVNWVGIRKVIWISGSCIMIEILEMAPEHGKRWFNYYDGIEWTGWRHSYSVA